MTLRWRDIDWVLLLLVLAICCIGVVQIYSATLGTKFAGVYVKQMEFVGLGLVLMLIMARLDYKLLLTSAPWLYGGAVALLAGVLVVGKAIFHSRRWIPVAGAHLQVSEFVKLVIIIAVARYFSDEARRGSGWKEMILAGLIVAFPMLLVMREPDLGTALTYLPIAVMGLLMSGMSWRYFALVVLAGMLVLPVGWHLLHPYQRERLETFWRPQTDPLGSGYQVLQSKIAVGAGGLWGQGWARGTQTRGAFLPVPQTDFIFAAFAEERGFVGALVLLLLYLLILMRLMQNAQLAPDRAGGLLIMGVVAVLAFHILVNVGMVVGMMPVTGIPLPLMSSGGSSLLFMFMALGMVMNIRMSRFVN